MRDGGKRGVRKGKAGTDKKRKMPTASDHLGDMFCFMCAYDPKAVLGA